MQIEHKCIVSPYLWDELLLYQPCNTPYLFPCVLAMPSRACQSSGCCPTQELRCQPGASDVLGSFSVFKLLSSGQVPPCASQQVRGLNCKHKNSCRFYKASHSVLYIRQWKGECKACWTCPQHCSRQLEGDEWHCGNLPQLTPR